MMERIVEAKDRTVGPDHADAEKARDILELMRATVGR